MTYSMERATHDNFTGPCLSAGKLHNLNADSGRSQFSAELSLNIKYMYWSKIL
jgi:hypothetical protein